MAQHISLKFQNDTANTGFTLRTLGLKTSSLPQHNITKINWVGQHVGIKFQGDALYALGLDTKKLTERNITKINWVANHMSLKFQNNTASTAFQLQTIGINVVELIER